MKHTFDGPPRPSEESEDPSAWQLDLRGAQVTEHNVDGGGLLSLRLEQLEAPRSWDAFLRRQDIDPSAIELHIFLHHTDEDSLFLSCTIADLSRANKSGRITSLETEPVTLEMGTHRNAQTFEERLVFLRELHKKIAHMTLSVEDGNIHGSVTVDRIDVLLPSMQIKSYRTGLAE